MSDIYIDNANNDLVFRSGDLVFTSDFGYGETIKSRIKSYLKTFLGEWFLDSPVGPIWGVPYFQNIFSDTKPTTLELDIIFRSAILGIEGVNTLTSLSIEQNRTTRELNIEFVAVSNSGNVIEDVIEISLGV
jgi:hypothetical protein